MFTLRSSNRTGTRPGHICGWNFLPCQPTRLSTFRRICRIACNGAATASCRSVVRRRGSQHDAADGSQTNINSCKGTHFAFVDRFEGETICGSDTNCERFCTTFNNGTGSNCKCDATTTSAKECGKHPETFLGRPGSCVNVKDRGIENRSQRK